MQEVTYITSVEPKPKSQKRYYIVTLLAGLAMGLNGFMAIQNHKSKQQFEQAKIETEEATAFAKEAAAYFITMAAANQADIAKRQSLNMCTEVKL